MADNCFYRFDSLFSVPLRNGLTKPKSVRGYGTKMVNMGEIFAYDRIHNIEMDRVALALRERETSLLEPGDLLFARQSLVLSGAGKCSLFTGDQEDVTFESHLIRCRLDKKRADPAFYFYLFRSTFGRSLIVSIVEQVAAAGIRGSDLALLQVPVPSFPKQSAVAQILSTLDDKIDVNRRMNETLEAIVQALFKSWFVDFEPVRELSGQMPEKPPFLCAEPLKKAGFPDRFQDSELGEIPEGWRVRALGEVLDVKHGYAFEGRYFRDTPPGDILLTPGNFRVGGGYKGDKHKYYHGPWSDGFILNEGDLLLTMTDLSKASDTLGFPAMLPCPPTSQRFLHNQRLGKVVITDLDSVGRLFLYRIFCGDDYRAEILASSTGTTVKHTSPDRIKAFKSVFPPPVLTAHYERTALPMHLRIASNQKESLSLADIRDTLLPKLLSGELRLKDSEELVEAVE